MVTKKTPLRKCTGCNTMKPKKELVRIVKNKDNVISLDTTSKMAGRGAYICNDVECLKKARKIRGLERAFSCKVPDEIYTALESAFDTENGHTS